jgi:hypothetical protein
MEFVVLAKIIAPWILLFFMVAITVCGIHDIYTRWKDKQLTTKYVMTFAIQYVIAAILSYDVYYEVLILSP